LDGKEKSLVNITLGSRLDVFTLEVIAPEKHPTQGGQPILLQGEVFQALGS